MVTEGKPSDSSVEAEITNNPVHIVQAGDWLAKEL